VKRRILFFSLSDSVYGGEVSLLTTILALPPATRDLTAVVVPARGRLTERLERHEIAWIEHPLNEPNGIWTAPLLYARARAWLRAQEASLLYFNAASYWRPLEILAAKHLRIPVVTHHRTDVSPLSPYHPTNRLVLANSHYLAGRIPRDDVVVVDNPVDLKRFEGVEPDPTRFGLAPGQTGVFFIGQLKRIKGVDEFIDAADLLATAHPNARFVLVGDTQDQEYRDHVRRRVAQTPNVVWSGYVPDVEVAFLTADIVAMPSNWDEPFGRIAIEAGAARKPIVATRAGGIPEVVAENETGLLCERESPDELAECIESLLQNPELRQRMGQAGRELAENRFAAERVAAKIEALIAPLLSGRGQPHRG